MKTKKAQLNISFGWIFAIVVGAVILSLAIFGVVRFVNLEKTQQSAETGKQLDTILNPLETGFETGQKVVISTSSETRIYSKCNSQNGLGNQKILTEQKTFNKFTEDGVNISLKNKYLFLENPVEGKNFYAFSKPFEFPTEDSYDFSFKVADLIYIFPNSKNYCFTNSPENIEEEISKLNFSNLFFSQCPEENVKVCFSGGNNCDIKVYYEAGYIEKNSERIYFITDSLMYAGIFSDTEEYECQVERLMNRAEQLTEIYSEKSRIEQNQGCDGDIESNLLIFGNLLEGYEDSEEILSIGNYAKQLNKINSNEGDCKLW
jgi:hypothetical protein